MGAARAVDCGKWCLVDCWPTWAGGWYEMAVGVEVTVRYDASLYCHHLPTNRSWHCWNVVVLQGADSQLVLLQFSHVTHWFTFSF